jgi:hypothetical protein
MNPLRCPEIVQCTLIKKQRQITIIIIVARLCSGLEQKDNNISLRHRQQMNPE